MLADLVLNQGAAPGRMRALLDPLPQSEQRKVVFLALKSFSEQFLDRLGSCSSDESVETISAVAGAIRVIVGEGGGMREHLVSWLTSSSGAGLGEGVGVRRAVLAVVAQDKDAVVMVLERSLAQFGDLLYIKHSPVLQQQGRQTKPRRRSSQQQLTRSQLMPRSC